MANRDVRSLLPEFPNGELVTSLALGAVTDRSVRVWLRHPAREALEVCLTAAGQPPVVATLYPEPEHDFVAAVDLTLPAPAPDARFTVEAVGQVRRGRFAPAEGAPAGFCFAFGSCHQPFLAASRGRLVDHPGAAIYPALARLLRRRGCRFVTMVGDQVYSDGVPPINMRTLLNKRRPNLTDADLLALYRTIYRGYFNEPGFRDLLNEFTGFMVWDDHDIFDGWGSLKKVTENDRRLFRAADQAYREYQHLRNPGSTLDERPPYHYEYWYGNTGFFTLDLRGVRHYPSGTLLGVEQMAAFARFLETATARGVPTVFIVASVPLAHFSPRLIRLTEGLPGSKGTDVRDRWNTRAFQAEHDTFTNLLFDWQAAEPGRQAIVLSGDVHAGAAFVLERQNGRGLIRQWTSSPLTTPVDAAQRWANRVGTRLMNWGQGQYTSTRQLLTTHANCGLVEVVPDGSGSHRLRFTLYVFDSRRGLHVTGSLTGGPDA